MPAEICSRPRWPLMFAPGIPGVPGCKSVILVSSITWPSCAPVCPLRLSLTSQSTNNQPGSRGSYGWTIPTQQGWGPHRCTLALCAKSQRREETVPGLCVPHRRTVGMSVCRDGLQLFVSLGIKSGALIMRRKCSVSLPTYIFHLFPIESLCSPCWP